MRLLLFSNLYRPEPTGVGPLSGGLADAMARAGHQVAVLAANPSYPPWRLFDGYSAWRWSRRDEDGVAVHRCPVFIPARVGGATRILHYSSFAVSAAAPALKLAWTFRPDVVLLVAPTLIAAPLALLTARLAGAKTWLHVQDFEVEAGFATGQMHADGAVARAALTFERHCIAGFDQTSSISPAMCRKLIEKGRSPATVHELRNWASVESIGGRDSTFRERWRIRTPHVVLYSGSIAKKQGIEIVVDVARRLQYRDDITFVLCGSGPTRPDLEARAAGLANIQFRDLQPKEDFEELLGLATIHLLPQRAGAADLVLPSKLANMLASGRPVVAGAAPGSDLAAEVEGCGIAVEPENSGLMAEAIERLVADPALYARCAAQARARAIAQWDRQAVLARFERHLVALSEAPAPPADQASVSRR